MRIRKTALRGWRGRKAAEWRRHGTEGGAAGGWAKVTKSLYTTKSAPIASATCVVAALKRWHAGGVKAGG